MNLLTKFSLASAQSFITVPVTIVTPRPATSVKTISHSCPTITSITHRPACTSVTKPKLFPGCATPDCILLSTITHRCSCPATVPTSFSYIPCTQCFGCRTSYVNIYEPCPFSPPPVTSTTKVVSPTTTTPACPTVTETIGSACPPDFVLDCFTPAVNCVVASEISLDCACPTAATVFSCKTKCGACLTEYITASLPCPVTDPLPTITHL